MNTPLTRLLCFLLPLALALGASTGAAQTEPSATPSRLNKKTRAKATRQRERSESDTQRSSERASGTTSETRTGTDRNSSRDRERNRSTNTETGVGTETQTTTTPEITTPPPEVVTLPEPAPSVPTGDQGKRGLPQAPRVSSPISVSYTGTILSLPLPFKHGPVVAFALDDQWSLEVSYFFGQLGFSLPLLDVASLKESLFLVNARYFFGNSFNFVGGLSHQSYEARLGNDLVSRITGISMDVGTIEVQTLGLQFGLGNKWQWGNGAIFSVDWLTLNVPLTTVKNHVPAFDYINNQGDRETVEKVLKVMRFLPTGTALKVGVGYAF